MTISLAPLWRALLMRWAKVVKVARGLAPPKEDTMGALEIGRRRRCAECMLRAPDRIPRADMRRGQNVRAAESIGEAQYPRFEIGGGTAGRGCASEDDRLGTVLFADFR
jgi:hypothetical protein